MWDLDTWNDIFSCGLQLSLPVTSQLMFHIYLCPEVNDTLIKPAHNCNCSPWLWLLIWHDTLSHLRTRNLKFLHYLGTWKLTFNFCHTGEHICCFIRHNIAFFKIQIPLLLSLKLTAIAAVARNFNLSRKGYVIFVERWTWLNWRKLYVQKL
jgi:hypothetical protein